MYREFQPAPHLKRFVECYWHRHDAFPDPRHRVLPDGCSDILFTSESGEPARLSFLGLMTVPLESPVAAQTQFFGIRFRPAMASSFLRELAALPNSNITLNDDACGRRLFVQLAEACTPEQMIACAESYLGSPKFDPPPPILSAALEGLHTEDPIRPATAGSQRHLRRLCREHTGISPKLLSRILRFRRAVERLRQRPQVRWADFAAACGYFDQAHLIREFQEFAGETPGRFLQSLRDEARIESGHGAITQT